MKKNLLSYCENYNFEKLFKAKGYSYFTKGSYNLNIIGVRKKGNKVTDKFDDVCVVIYKDNDNVWRKKVYSITTDPGKFYMNNPTNIKGTAILVPNQYKGCWALGLHKNKSKALVQIKPVKVYRDSNKDDVMDFNPNSIDEGVFGINLHRAGTNSYVVNNWSAGCQVWANTKDHVDFIRLCEKQVSTNGSKTFTYTLLNEEDLI